MKLVDPLYPTEDFIIGDCAHHRPHVALALLEHVYPAGLAFVERMAVDWAPMYSLNHEGIEQGCICGGWWPKRVVWSTTNSLEGAIEGLLHETGHMWLHDRGIHLEEWDANLLANSPTELYESPIRKDRRRPMGAVLHAQYSYLWVLAWYDALGDPKRAERTDAIRLALKQGGTEILHNVKANQAGLPIVEDILYWTRMVTR